MTDDNCLFLLLFLSERNGAASAMSQSRRRDYCSPQEALREGGEKKLLLLTACKSSKVLKPRGGAPPPPRNPKSHSCIANFCDPGHGDDGEIKKQRQNHQRPKKRGGFYVCARFYGEMGKSASKKTSHILCLSSHPTLRACAKRVLGVRSHRPTDLPCCPPTSQEEEGHQSREVEGHSLHF